MGTKVTGFVATIVVKVVIEPDDISAFLKGRCRRYEYRKIADIFASEYVEGLRDDPRIRDYATISGRATSGRTASGKIEATIVVTVSGNPDDVRTMMIDGAIRNADVGEVFRYMKREVVSSMYDDTTVSRMVDPDFPKAIDRRCKIKAV